MKIKLTILIATILAFVAIINLKAESGNDYVKVSLDAPTHVFKPGDTVLLAVQFKMEPEWHVYWKNPGDAGLSPEFAWKLPNGAKVIETDWQYPAQIPFDEFINFGYENQTTVFVKILIPKTYSLTLADLSCDVGFLVCKEKCIPGKQTVSIRLNSKLTEITPGSDKFQRELRKIPRKNNTLNYSAKIEKDTLTLKVKSKDNSTIRGNKFELFPEEEGMYLYSTAKVVERKPGEIVFNITLDNYRPNNPEKISGVIVSDEPFLDTVQNKAIEFETPIISNK